MSLRQMELIRRLKRPKGHPNKEAFRLSLSEVQF
jgi:hypothetical protein